MLPPWASQQLDQNPNDQTVRLIVADWLEEHGHDPLLAQFYRYMGIAQLYPAIRLMSRSLTNMTEGYGWFSDSSRHHALVPVELWPPKHSVTGRNRDWVFPTRQDAESWLYQQWCRVSEETREMLLEKAREKASQ